LKIYDISVPLRENMPVWPHELGFEKKQKHIGPICVTEIKMGLHAGTHLDAPYHFIPGGKKIAEIPLERFIGPARVVEISNPKQITVKELREKELHGCPNILFKTENYKLWSSSEFNHDFLGLDLEAAKYMTDIGVNLVGADYLSVEAFGSEGGPVHINLLQKEIIILEGLDLSEVAEGDYYLFCAPLKILDVEASPVRAFLIQNDEWIFPQINQD